MSKASKRAIAREEIAACAAVNRVIRVQPYTLARWANATGLQIVQDLASKNRSIKVQPYTFAMWIRELDAQAE